MSSIARSRSLRKPNAITQPPEAATSADADRHASPSRLPTRNHVRTASSTKSNSTTGSSTSAKSTRPLVRSASTRQPVTEQQAKSRYPPSTTTTRPSPTTMTRPTSSGGTATRKAAPTAGHTRAKSTTTGSASNLSSNTVLRPPSQGTTRTAHGRNVSTDRTTKPATRSTSREGATKPSMQTTTRTQATSQVTARAQPKLRPQFSTLQQHYSPAKSRDPKPLTATYLAPPSPSKLPANVQASAETTKLQAELLQLHLLHRDAARVDAQWRASAKTKLGERFARLGVAADEVAGKEKDGLERENVLALRRWANDGGLDTKIQGLDAVMNGLWNLTERGGRYARVVRRFERWMDRVSEIEHSRRDETYLMQSDQNLFVGDLETGWEEDCSEIMRRLNGWKRQMGEMGWLPEEGDANKSSLERMLDSCRSMIHDMLAELKLMEEIEAEALAREEAWIEKINQEDDEDDTRKAGALWRVI